MRGVILSTNLSDKYNKQFKRDSQRSAFLLLLQIWCLWHNVLGFGGGVVHPLIGRYAFSQTCKYGYFTYSVNITMYHLLKMRFLSLNRR